ncbi:hypothetical protein QT972_32165 [Microcoleus sp. herbarium7]|uniref:hypothetical protein n=1 Tax=Microcoleus sp. herbarium7 TaxID=3055435 RepID=UPI002FD362CC
MDLSQFNVFIGETGAIDGLSEKLIDINFIYDSTYSDLRIDYIVNEFDVYPHNLEELLYIMGFDRQLLKKGTIRRRHERIVCSYLVLVSSSLSSQVIGFEDFGLYLDPRLCRRLTEELFKLAKSHDKTIFLFTHNVGCLDGLDLDNDDQRLFVAKFNHNDGDRVMTHRVNSPKPLEGQEPVRLSEAYLRGYIGGLRQKNF